MGFSIRNPTTGHKQFVTAGHCGYNWFPPPYDYFNLGPTWYMVNYGEIGELKSSFFSQQWGWDIMRVGMPDAQASNRILGDSKVVAGYGNVLANDAVCVSLGTTGYVECGFVLSDYATWTDNEYCDCVLNGALTSIYVSQGGDSGSPVYRPISASQATALAIFDRAGGGVTKLKPALDTWNWVIVTN